jgi:hypothetical protein
MTARKLKKSKPDVWRNRIVGYGKENPEKLVSNRLNYRLHPDSQQESLTAVLQEIGLVQNIIVNKRTGYVVDGHLRLRLALREGVKKIPVTYVDLTEDEERIVLATLDPITNEAVTDPETLTLLLDGLQPENETIKNFMENLADEAGLFDDEQVKDAVRDGLEGVIPEAAGTQCVIGSYKFPISREDYTAWLNTIRERVGFDDGAVVKEIRRRLKI